MSIQVNERRTRTDLRHLVDKVLRPMGFTGSIVAPRDLVGEILQQIGSAEELFPVELRLV